MLKKSLLSALIFLLGHAVNAQTLLIDAPGKKGELRAEEVKRMIESCGLGILAHVEITLRNGKKMEGFIDRAARNHFYLVRTDEETGAAAVVAYNDVAEIECQKSTMDWRNIAIRTGLGAGAMLAYLRSSRTTGSITELKLKR